MNSKNKSQLLTGYNEFRTALQEYAGPLYFDNQWSHCDMAELIYQIAEVPGIIAICLNTEIPCSNIFTEINYDDHHIEFVCEDGTIVQTGRPEFLFIKDRSDGVTQPKIEVKFLPVREFKGGCEEPWDAWKIQDNEFSPYPEFMNNESKAGILEANQEVPQVLLAMNRPLDVVIMPELSMIKRCRIAVIVEKI
ncbi:MAG: hypothetical protein WAX04_13325 [Oscillospiraceae bacterium]